MIGKYDNHYLPDDSGVYSTAAISDDQIRLTGPFATGLERFRIITLKGKILIFCVPCQNFPITCDGFSVDLTEVLDKLAQHRCGP